MLRAGLLLLLLLLLAAALAGPHAARADIGDQDIRKQVRVDPPRRATHRLQRELILTLPSWVPVFHAHASYRFDLLYGSQDRVRLAGLREIGSARAHLDPGQ
jgi:hypothetical protein